MKSNRLSVGVVFVFVTALTAGLATSGVVPSVGRIFADVPTTIATLQNDSEGLAVDPKAGTMYAAEAPNAVGDCIVRSVTLDGNLSLVGYVPKPASGACAPRGLEFRAGLLYISDQGTGSSGWVYEMNPATGFVTTFAAGVAGANGIVFDSTGNLWITDGLRGLGRVYRRDATTGVVQEVFRVPPIANGTTYGGRLTAPSAAGVGRFIANVPSGPQGEVKAVANGIAFVDRNDAAFLIGQGRPRLSTLYVADTTRGAIWAVLIDAQGNLAPGQTGCDPTLQDNTLCDDEIFVSHPRLEGADGIWADTDRSLWVAANARQAIIRIDRHGNITEVFRNPVNSQLLRSSADTPEGDRHLLEYPTNPVIVPVKGSPFLTRLCVASTDRPGRDNAPGTVGEIGGPGQDKGKISCF